MAVAALFDRLIDWGVVAANRGVSAITEGISIGLHQAGVTDSTYTVDLLGVNEGGTVLPDSWHNGSPQQTPSTEPFAGLPTNDDMSQFSDMISDLEGCNRELQNQQQAVWNEIERGNQLADALRSANTSLKLCEERLEAEKLKNKNCVDTVVKLAKDLANARRSSGNAFREGVLQGQKDCPPPKSRVSRSSLSDKPSSMDDFDLGVKHTFRRSF